MGVRFYIMCLDLFTVDFTVDAAAEAVLTELNKLELELELELNRLNSKVDSLKKALEESERRRKEEAEKFAEEMKKLGGEIEALKQQLKALEEEMTEIEQHNASLQVENGNNHHSAAVSAVWTHRGTSDWVGNAVAASTGALAAVVFISYLHLRKKQ